MDQWYALFRAIDDLRILNKYHSDILIQNLHKFYSFISDSVNNLRSGISKNALLFTNEFFTNKE